MKTSGNIPFGDSGAQPAVDQFQIRFDHRVEFAFPSVTHILSDPPYRHPDDRIVIERHIPPAAPSVAEDQGRPPSLVFRGSQFS